MSTGEALARGSAMDQVRYEAKRLLSEYSNNLETSKPEIISNLKEYGREEAGILVEKVVVWDNGSIDIEFGPMLCFAD